VKTDDPTTRQRNEVAGDDAKVVRLSDWLAPDDELVPFGPRAHARTATRDPAEGRADPDSGADPPAASAFWDGDTSVHTAVPGPGIFDEPGGPTGDRPRYRRPAAGWGLAPPPLHLFSWGSHACGRLADLVDRITWRWAAATVAFVALALTVLLITLGGGSSGRHDTAAQAAIGNRSPTALRGTLGEIGTATGAAAVSDLRALPSVDVAVRTIGLASKRAGALAARHRPHAVLAPASVPNPSTTESVETPTTPAPAETEPTQTTPPPTPTGGGGGGGSTTGGGGSTASSANSTSAFGPGGALGPGSSPDS
jgi:hypothetical protein